MTELEFPIETSDLGIKNNTEYIKLILEKLNITGDIYNKIIDEFGRYNDNKLYKIKDKIKIDDINALIKYDGEINSLITKDGPFYKYYEDEKIKENWDNTMENLARLQGLIILRKLVKDCDSGIEALAKAMTNKLDTVNSMIEAQLSDN
jgi:hypothetical protein